MDWATEEALRCRCGLPRDVSMREGGDDDFEASPMQCHACAAINRRASAWKGDNLPALFWSVKDLKEAAGG